MAKLSQIMSSEVFTITVDTPVSEVARSMVKGRIGSALVTEGSTLAGIFTERDVLRAAASGDDLTATPVRKWMTEDPVTAEPDLDSEDAAELMLAQGFRHLPVMQGNGVEGIVSLRDLLSARIRRH